MSPTALPWIEQGCYPRIQQIVPELRHTSYNEWIEEHGKAVAYRTSRNGSVDIPISAQEFDTWLTDNHEAGHLELLWVFAEEKVARPTGPGHIRHDIETDTLAVHSQRQQIRE